MKRELAFAIQSFIELGALPGRTRSSILQPGNHDDGVPESSMERRKGPSNMVVKGSGEINERPIGTDLAKEPICHSGLSKVPTTVKELFATGLLEGYPVFYNGAMQGPPLRGLVKDVGIMCLCSSCMGSRIFTPVLFEIHARDTYKHAAQFICFENGSSLLDLVKACEESCLDSLDETILRVVGPLPIKESIVTSTSSVSLTSEEKNKYKLKKKDRGLHKIVFEEDGLPDGTEVAYYSDGKKLLLGYKKEFGICCSCCKTVVSASTFEAHAGWGTRRKPYNYIYTSNGVSLHEFAISLLKNRMSNAGQMAD